MSNCDFYAAFEDMLDILNFIYAETDCRVFEHSSAFGKELREFTSTVEIADAFNLGHCPGKHRYSALLQLHTPSAAGEVRIRRIDLAPKRCDGHTFRHEVSGWGLIQLYLGGVSESGIHHSHTNHNSEKRARKWEATYLHELGSIDRWDWKALSKVSRKIGYHIRSRLAIAKHGCHPVLPAAQALFETGFELLAN